ncbi:phosphoserine phosphatase SerB [Microbulbifer sp. OS29]|uniref:Phosphoserine phosphatase n=1 Tax=Microbulbifer okhotskensis TaxID=2926617 RepID=A0A9X2J436_9GAMM|nr:phosphoserine phosphatase SerB [Microbulbifer okhotskensis]MCO1334122.1 phosphoserine phosphatase SerB [Microbulbifer okhotskensis]
MRQTFHTSGPVLMGDQTNSQEFHLSLEQITQAPADCTLRYLDFHGTQAKLGVEYSGTAPFTRDGIKLSPAPEQAAPLQASWCVTLLSPSASLAQLQQLMRFFDGQQWTLVAADTLAQRPECTVIRFQIEGDLNFDRARLSCLRVADQLGADLVIQAAATQRVPALAGFDMDSTLIDAEVIDELAKITGIGDQVTAITQATMAGDMDFCESFKRRMALLKGFSEKRLAEIAQELPLKEGAYELLTALRALGCKTALLSGGFTYFAEFLRRERLPLDFTYANELKFAEGALTGEVVEPIIDGDRKRKLLTEIAEKLNISLERVVAMGDGANDIPMLNLGELGIAIHPKPKVRMQAPQAINLFGLDAALYLFGLNDRQIEKLG